MPTLKAQDENGRTVAFEWFGDQPPTEADLAEVFAAQDAQAEQSVRDRPPSMAELDMGFGAGGFSEDDRVRVQREGRKQLPAVGGIIGSVGGPVGSGIGAALGSLANSAIEDGSIDGGDAVKAGKEGAITAATGWGIGKAIDAARPIVAPILKRGAERLMKGALKMDRGYLEKMAGARKGGIVKMETDIARTALEKDVNPLRQSGTEKIQGLIDDVSSLRQAKINRAPNVPVRGSGARADRAARVEQARLSKGDAVGDDMATARAFLDDLRASPHTSEVKSTGVSFAEKPSALLDASGKPIVVTRAVPGAETRGMKDLTPRELDETVQAGNARLKGLFHGNSKNAEVQSRLGVQRARAGSLDRAAGTRGESQEMKRLIDLRNVAQIARRRADARDPIGITDIISLSAGAPLVTAGSAAMKPAAQAGLARMLSRGGRSVANPSELGDLIRQALIAGTINQP